jgi:hypothetical protein
VRTTVAVIEVAVQRSVASQETTGWTSYCVMGRIKELVACADTVGADVVGGLNVGVDVGYVMFTSRVNVSE